MTIGMDESVVYDSNNRIVEYRGTSVTYDDDGNMESSPIGAFKYDWSNRLITADTYSYVYDVENIRTKKCCCDSITEYTHNANSKLSQLLMKTENGVTTYYVYGRGLIGEEVNSAFKTYHYDYRGSTVAITDETGAVTDRFGYDTYGRLISKTGTTNTQFLYNGRDGVMSDENGLVYMRARYYSPELKRFINADVIAGSITNAITLNRYAYANGNPVSNIDPFGLSPERGGNSSNKNFSPIAFGVDDGITENALDGYKYPQGGGAPTNQFRYALKDPTYTCGGEPTSWDGKAIEALANIVTYPIRRHWQMLKRIGETCIDAGVWIWENIIMYTVDEPVGYYGEHCGDEGDIPGPEYPDYYSNKFCNGAGSLVFEDRIDDITDLGGIQIW